MHVSDVDDHPAPVPPPRSPGRPLDPVLTDRLRERATTLLIERGSDGLTANLLAADTRAGKAGIYRRWPDMRALEAELLERARVLPEATETTTPDLEVRALAESWTRPPDRDGQVAAALLSRTVVDAGVRRAMQSHLHDGLRTWWEGLGGSATEDAAVLHMARALVVAHWVSGPLDRAVTTAFIETALRTLAARSASTATP